MNRTVRSGPGWAVVLVHGDGAYVAREYLEFDCPGCLAKHLVPIGHGGWQLTLEPGGGVTLFPEVALARFPPRAPADEAFTRACRAWLLDSRLSFAEDCDHDLAGFSAELEDLSLVGGLV